MISKQEEITTFSLDIEKLVKTKKVSYMDAILLYCEQTGVEIEVAAKLISGALKAKIKVEAEELNFLPKTNTNKLPV
jgi:Phage late-transcription coactivator